MNVVERDALVVDQEESTPQEIGITRRSGAKNVLVSPSGSKVNRLPSIHDRVVQQRVDGRSAVSNQSRNLQAFIAPFETKIRQISKFRSKKYRRSAQAQAKVAELVLEVIRQLAFRETGVFNLEAPVPQLLSALFAGAVEVGIVTGLARRAQKALLVRDAQQREAHVVGAGADHARRGLSYDVSRELDELIMLLKWYVTRKMSVTALELGFVDAVGCADGYEETAQDSDVLFGLEVMHDHQVFGVKGCLVACGLRLLGRDGEALWLRVSLVHNGTPVAARQDWQSWTDPGSGEAVEVLPESSPFCSLVPIRPNSQRLVIDEVRAFVPYAALQLPAGRAEVDLCISVIDGDGNEVLGVARQESICVPHNQLIISPVPSPHSVGMWPHDVVSGDKISDLSITSGFKLIAGWERHCITVGFDLSLFMHAGNSVMLECRFVDTQGDVVELSSLGMPFVASEQNVAVEAVSSYRYRRVLHPKGAWALYQGLCIDIPVEFLRLDAGVHEITCELVVVSSDERVLCGDMGRMEVQILNREQDVRAEEQNRQTGAKLPAKRVVGGDSRQVDLESLDVEASWRFGEDECIRVCARFTPRSHSQHLAELAAGRVGELFAPYRVEISLEREDAHVLLQAYSDPLGMSFRPVTRAVCVDPYSSQSEHCIVANFKKNEVLGWSLGNENGRVGSKWRLFARVTVLSLDGEVLLVEHKEFFIKPLTAGGRQVVPARGSSATIVDVVAFANIQSERLAIKALINVPAEDKLEEGMRVQCALLVPGREPQLLGVKELLTHNQEVWTRQVAGLCQYVVELDHQLVDAPIDERLSVEISLLSGADDLLHVVTQQAKVSGVLAEVDDTAADFDSDTPVSELSGETPFSFGSESTKPIAAKGLLRRIFKRPQ